jgi:transcriptional regulator with GAF, ATPase, and Fis domain
LVSFLDQTAQINTHSVKVYHLDTFLLLLENSEISLELLIRNMKIELESPDTLSLERKIKMHEAREGIIDRLARDLPTNIDIERFLRVVVSEIGRMMEVDRCDLLQLTNDGELKINNEWRREEAIPSSLGTVIPIDLEKLAGKIDLSKAIPIADIGEINEPAIKFLAKALETKSLLIVPISLNQKVLGLLGLHMTTAVRRWNDEEVAFLESIARHLAIGYQYTSLYVAQEQETERTNSLLEIANTLNSYSNFQEAASKVLSKAVEIVGANYGALGVLDNSGEKISLASFEAAEGIEPSEVVKMIGQHGESLDIAPFPALKDILRDGKTFRLVDSQLPPTIRLIFNSQLGGKTALISPVRIAGQAFGLIGFVWGPESERSFGEHDIALVEGIADQIGTALERNQLSAEVMRLKSELHQRQSEIVGQAPPLRRAIELALNVASVNSTVLIQGESGTGKELFANLIHFNSGRSDEPFIKINCGAIPESLLESELFGHEKGAFTDARSQRKGRFEEADGGTLFLDEIGEMSLTAQVRLLRILQDGELTRIGGNDVIKTDVRVIAATNVDLERSVEEGRFRKDLYYRLSVFPISLPPLRDRPEDIHLLLFHFLEDYKEKTGRFVSGISKEALKALVNYEWPGNVRELENAIERAVIIASGRQVEIDDLPEVIGGASLGAKADAKEERIRAASEGRSIAFKIEFPMTIGEMEREAVVLALEYTGGDKSKAAKLLGIGRKTLYRKLAEYGLSS